MTSCSSVIARVLRRLPRHGGGHGVKTVGFRKRSPVMWRKRDLRKIR